MWIRSLAASRKVTGDITGDENVLVEGTVEGTIRISRDLRVGPGGRVKATVSAQSVVVAGEVRRPAQSLWKILVTTVLIVTVLYLLLNYVFLRTVPLTELAGRLEIGALSAVNIFGEAGGVLASAMICVLLVSSISAMVLAGPRVLQVAGEDLPGLRPLAVRTRGGAPLPAILLQQVLATQMIAVSNAAALRDETLLSIEGKRFLEAIRMK